MFQIFPPVFSFLSLLFCPSSICSAPWSKQHVWQLEVGLQGLRVSRRGCTYKARAGPHQQSVHSNRLPKKKKKRKSFAQVLDCVMFWWVCVFRCFHWIVVYVHISERACLFHSDVSIWCTCNVKTNKKNIQNYYASKTRLEYRL